MIDLALDDRIYIDDNLDAALQELDILFNTTNSELLGDTSYGCFFEQFLWALTPTSTDLQNYIQEKIDGTYFLSQYQTDIQVQFVEGEYQSVYIVKIGIVEDGYEIINKIYEFK